MATPKRTRFRAGWKNRYAVIHWSSQRDIVLLLLATGTVSRHVNGQRGEAETGDMFPIHRPDKGLITLQRRRRRGEQKGRWMGHFEKLLRNDDVSRLEEHHRARLHRRQAVSGLVPHNEIYEEIFTTYL